jgi:hypothetical protein
VHTALIQKQPPTGTFLLGLKAVTFEKMFAGGVAKSPPFRFSLITKLNHAKTNALMEWISNLTVSPVL